MGRKVESKKKLAQSEDNFYKYSPKNTFVNYQYPQYSFSQTILKTLGEERANIGPGSYDGKLRNSSGEGYTIPKKERFKPLVK